MGKRFTSNNTTVLETHADERDQRNVRMLLFYNSGTFHEYIVGSYFTEDTTSDGITHYSWDWGHYFESVLSAARFWEEEVIGNGGME